MRELLKDIIVEFGRGLLVIATLAAGFAYWIFLIHGV